MFSTINDIFNTREIATAILFLVFSIYVLSKNAKGILESLKNVFKAFFTKKILMTLFIMFLYSLGLVYILNSLGCWENHQIKNYIFWLIGVGVLTHFQKDTYSIKKAF